MWDCERIGDEILNLLRPLICCKKLHIKNSLLAYEFELFMLMLCMWLLFSRLFQEDDYVQLAAKHYYIQYGSESSLENARKVVRECLRLDLIESKSEAKLVQLVSSAHSQVL